MAELRGNSVHVRNVIISRSATCDLHKRPRKRRGGCDMTLNRSLTGLSYDSMLVTTSCTALLQLYCSSADVLYYCRCTVLLPVYYSTAGVLFYYRCTVLLPVYCSTAGVLFYYRCTVLLPVYYSTQWRIGSFFGRSGTYTTGAPLPGLSL